MPLPSTCMNLLSHLKETSTSKDLTRGKILHAFALLDGYFSDLSISSSLINMYGKCGSLVNAKLVFDGMPFHNVVSWNSLLLACAENGEEQTVMSYFSSMQTHGYVPNSRTYVAVLKAVNSPGNKKSCSLERTVAVHSQAEENNCLDDIFLANTLIDLYGKSGSMSNAQSVFDRMSFKNNVVSWTSLMLGYVESGDPELAVTLFLRMQREGCQPNDRAFVAAVKACTGLAAEEHGEKVDGKVVKLASLNKGMEVHSQAAESLYDLDIFVGSTLVGMYGKSGSLADARRVFDRMRERDLVSWSAMILGYAENGEGEMALKLFACMGPSRCKPDALAYVAALKGCISLAAVEEGVRVDGKLVKMVALERAMEVHSQALASRFESHTFVASTLTEVYLTCGSLPDARKVFDRVPQHDVVLWTSLIQGYVEHGEGEIALELFQRLLQFQSLQPDALTYAAALKACSVVASNRKVDGGNFTSDCLERGVEVHRRAAEAGFGSHVLVESSVLNMYSKCGCLLAACRVFESMASPNLLAYNTLVLGCVEHGENSMALQMYTFMQAEGLGANSATFVGVFKACAALASQEDGKLKSSSLEKGRRLHEQAAACGCTRDSTVSCSAIDMFAKCGGLEDARRVFEEGPRHCVVAWNALMMGYVDNDEASEALELFSLMHSHCSPDGRTFVTVAKACICLAAKEDSVEKKMESLQKARSLQAQAESLGWGRDTFVASTLMELYTKCGSMEDARRTFDRIPSPSLVSWTVLMLGYIEAEKEMEALEVYRCFRAQNWMPNAVILGAGLKACGGTAALPNHAKELYREICRFGLEHALGSCLVDCFGKLGGLSTSQEVFDWLPVRETSGWNSLIDAYSRQGEVECVIDLFCSMQEEGVKANRNTFAAVLSACSHAGLVNKGMVLFKKMEARYGVYPDIQHYTSVVDLLGRGNQIGSAMEVIQSMPYQPSAVVWRSLLGACRKWKDVEVGKIAFEALLELDRNDAATYELMANTYVR